MPYADLRPAVETTPGSRPVLPGRPIRKFTSGQAVRVYKEMLGKGRLRLPVGVELLDPVIPPDQPQPDLLAILAGDPPLPPWVAPEHPAAAWDAGHAEPRTRSPERGGGADGTAAERRPAAEPARAPAAAAAPAPVRLPDAWVYKDPQGVIQGPFCKVGPNNISKALFPQNPKPGTLHLGADREIITFSSLGNVAWYQILVLSPGFACLGR